MEFMLLIYENEAARKDVPEAKMREVFEAYGQYTQTLRDAEAMRSGNALQPSETATTVRVRGGQRETADGPQGAAQEQLAGYYVIDCKDLDEALTWASKVPSAQFGSIEVRPILAM